MENFRPYASYYNDRISYGEWELDSFTVNNTVFNVGDEWDGTTLTRDFAYLEFFEDGTATIGFDGAYGRGVFTECWTHLSGEIDEHTLEILLSRTFETVLLTYDSQTELCTISYRRSGTPYQSALRRTEQ